MGRPTVEAWKAINLIGERRGWALGQARSALNHALRDGKKLEAWRFQSEPPGAAVAIPHHWWVAGIVIGADGKLQVPPELGIGQWIKATDILDAGTKADGVDPQVWLDQDNIDSLWPETEQVQPSPPQTSAEASNGEADLPKTLPDPKAATSRHAGGRPERPDWLEFDQEAIAKAVLDGGDLTRSELNRFMDTWAKDHLRKPLDERQTRQRINKLFRKGLLADD